MKFPTFLRIAIVTNMDLFKVNTSTDNITEITGGLESEFLKLLSHGLKFNYKFDIPEDKEWGRLIDNDSWTGIIGLVSRDEADIGISKLGVTLEKLSAVDFSYPYSIDKVTFATRPPGYLSKESAIIRPFAPHLWLALFITFFSIIFSFKIVFGKRYTLPNISLAVFGSFLGQYKILKPNKWSEKVIMLSVTICVMLLSCCYTSLLLSFLTFPFQEKPVDNAYRLQEAIKYQNYKCITFHGSAILNTLNKSEDVIVASISNQIIENNWLIEPTNDQSWVNLFNEKNIAVINLEERFKIIPENEILIAKDYFFLLYSGIAISKYFCCKKELDLIVHRIYASGLYQKSENDFYFKSRLQNMKSFENILSTKKTLQLKDLISAFVLLLSGYAISVSALIVEIIMEKRKRSRRSD